MRVGFACGWNRPPEPTWSYIPWQLRAALRDRAEVVDLDVQPPRVVEAALVRAQRALHPEAPVGQWRFLAVEERRRARRLRAMTRRSRPDAVVGIEMLTPLPVPQWIYQDLGIGVLDDAIGRVDPAHLPLMARDPATYRRRRELHVRLFDSGAGVLAMSRWAADALVERRLLPPERVQVVYAGVTARPPAAAAPAGRRRLLFVGRDFHRKAGDLVVAAVELLRSRGDDVTLTVAGPDAWPLPDAVPDGVRFLGRLSAAETGRLYAEHDAFVMPSRYEAFGIVFAEALAAGLPCVARRAFAMPEIVTDGVDGVLVDGEDIDELAGAISRVLDDAGFASRAWSGREDVAARFSWGAVADRVVAVL